MRCRVELFARARDLAGVAMLTVELADGARVAELRAALGVTCPALEPLLRRSSVAVAGEFAADDVVVTESDEIALLPPVSGG
jgi:molybdopterin converting factor small subunit